MSRYSRTMSRVAARCATHQAGICTARPQAHAAYTAMASVDAGRTVGALNPNAYGSMFEWGQDDMNRAWAEEVRDRGFENDTFAQNSGALYDHFRGGSLSGR